MSRNRDSLAWSSLLQPWNCSFRKRKPWFALLPTVSVTCALWEMCLWAMFTTVWTRTTSVKKHLHSSNEYTEYILRWSADFHGFHNFDRTFRGIKSKFARIQRLEFMTDWKQRTKRGQEWDSRDAVLSRQKTPNSAVGGIEKKRRGIVHKGEHTYEST